MLLGYLTHFGYRITSAICSGPYAQVYIYMFLSVEAVALAPASGRAKPGSDMAGEAPVAAEMMSKVCSTIFVATAAFHRYLNAPRKAFEWTRDQIDSLFLRNRYQAEKCVGEGPMFGTSMLKCMQLTKYCMLQFIFL